MSYCHVLYAYRYLTYTAHFPQNIPTGNIPLITNTAILISTLHNLISKFHPPNIYCVANNLPSHTNTHRPKSNPPDKCANQKLWLKILHKPMMNLLTGQFPLYQVWRAASLKGMLCHWGEGGALTNNKITPEQTTLHDAQQQQHTTRALGKKRSKGHIHTRTFARQTHKHTHIRPASDFFFLFFLVSVCTRLSQPNRRRKC